MSHPEPEALAAYHAGELTEPEERRLQDHLVGCPECAALLLDLDGLSDPGFGAGSLPPADQEALWGRIQGEIRKDEAPRAPAPVVPLRRPAGLAVQPRWLQLAAAALLVIALGQAVWLASLQRRVAALSRLQLDAPTIDLYSSGSRSEGSPRPGETVPPDAQFFILILNPENPRSTSRYRVEITRASGERVWTSEWTRPRAEPDPYDPVTLPVRRSLVGPGDYRIHWREETGQRIGDYELRVPGP
jgi:Putative zinc-finger